MRGQAALLPLALIALTFAGCVSAPMEPSLPPIAGERLEVYEYRFEGDAFSTMESGYGWMARLTNTGTGPVNYTVVPFGPFAIDYGLATSEGYNATKSDLRKPLNATFPGDDSMTHTLPGGASALWLFQTRLMEGNHVVGFTVHRTYEAEAGTPGLVRESSVHERGVDAARGRLIFGGEHVRTATVGVWANGTSFYTNIVTFADNESFPIGFADPVDGTPLPIYVYNDDPSEQPAGSKDRCYFVTIPGYNALLRSQAPGTTGVRYVAPEEAYTREGNEDHPLYGHALIFLNLIAVYEPSHPVDMLPDPSGDCFDPTHVVPSLPVPLLPKR